MSETRIIKPQPGPQMMAAKSKARILVFGGGAGGGKALPISQEVQTPQGPRAIGTLKPGDLVLGRDGRTCSVLWCSDVQTPSVVFRLTFDNGEVIQACAEHQWVTCTDAERKAGARRGRVPEPQVRTTQEIADTLLVPGRKARRTNHAVPVCAQLELSEVKLPLAPYLLGLWLGDGNTDAGDYSSEDPELWQAWEREGWTLGSLRQRDPQKPFKQGTILKLTSTLRDLGVLGVKHVPEPYLLASAGQRLALLQGLIDTDGHVEKGKGGRVEFCNTNKKLADAVYWLAASLGAKPTICEGRASLYGKDCGPKWSVYFTPAFQPCRLPRKLAAWQPRRRKTQNYHYIVAAERVVDPGSMMCIAVDSPDHTYLISRACIPTHNSWYQAWRAAKYSHIKGYNAIIFRRTFKMLEGGGSLLDETRNFYPDLGGKFNQNRSEWVFDGSRARVELKHMQHEKDAVSHKSKQYDYIGLDEGSEFEGKQFFFIISRLRGMANVPRQVAVTTNPDPDCYLRSLIDWWIGEDGYPIMSRAGVVRHYVRVKDEIVWAATPEELLRYVENDPRSVMSLTFIPSLLSDNQILMDKDPEYLANLKSMTAVERDRYLGGNWNVRQGVGDFFQKVAFKVWGQTDLERVLLSQEGRAADIVQSVRCWDTASTPIEGELIPGVIRPESFKARDGKLDNPDWTVSVKLDRTRNGRIVIPDATFHRDSPGAVQALQLRCAQQDGPRTTVVIFRDPGQAGDDQAERLATDIRRFAPCVVMDTQNKDWHAREASKAAFRGELHYLERPWNTQFFNQLEGFPDPKSKDDAVSALAGAYRYLLENPIPSFDFIKVETKYPDEVLQDPRLAVQLLSKKEQLKRGVQRLGVGGTRRWGSRNY
jgi:phage terminase large subunit-like protein